MKTGQIISHYKILGKLGEGGMGVVYKAHDTRLDRIVALKFLSHYLTSNEAERARFLQEAKAAAVLSHPNVCVIHDILERDNQQFIVMEYVEGETLRHHFAVAPMTVHEAIGYALQIADALNEAHSKGIVHRDVKSENIMITPKNQVKVMDFGLAKLKGSVKLTKSSGTTGTLAYMAPEQIRGEAVDPRADIFSLGVVIYEMLCATTPFRGEHEAAMMYSILNEEPQPIESHRDDIPEELSQVISRALEKNPDERYQSIADMLIDLRRDSRDTKTITKPTRIPVQKASPVSPPTRPTLRHRRRLILRLKKSAVWISAGLLAVLGVFLYVKIFAKPVALKAVFEQITDQIGVEYYPDYSPDGSFVAYSRFVEGSVDIFLQRIGGNPINLTKDSEDFDYAPAFSPDGQWIVFRSERKGGGIYVMGSTGESVRRLSNFGYNPAWTPDGKSIIVATEAVLNPVGRITTSKLWSIDFKTGNYHVVYEGDAVQPAVSPHNLRIAFWGLLEGSGVRDIWTIPINGGEPVPVTQDQFVDWDPVWSPDGDYLYFSSDRGGTMNVWRVPIDEKSGLPEGEPEPLTTPASWAGHIKISRDGKKIVYVAQDEKSNVQRVKWDPVESTTEELPHVIIQKNAYFLNCSPDGQWLALSTTGAQEDIFVIRADGSERRQLTDDIYKDRGPVWSPDGRKIYFYSNRTGRYEMWSISADGSDLRQVTDPSNIDIFEPQMFPDGKRLVVNSFEKGACLIDLEKPPGERKPVPIVRKDSVKANFRVASVTSDGQRLCGNFERPSGELAEGIVVYDMATQKAQRITDYGVAYTWLHQQNKIIYVARDNVFSLDLTTRDVRLVMKSPPNSFMTALVLPSDDQVIYFVTTTVDSDIWQAKLEE